ncbi:hypothetical protein BH20BAC1_BH20BAC1_22320 [soil metagenome]
MGLLAAFCAYLIATVTKVARHNLKTTERYLHVSNQSLVNITKPPG